MLYNDIIAPSHPGGFHLLPLGLRALEKLTRLVDFEMNAIGGQKISMTTLAPKSQWMKSGNNDYLGVKKEDLIALYSPLELFYSYISLIHRNFDQLSNFNNEKDIGKLQNICANQSLFQCVKTADVE